MGMLLFSIFYFGVRWWVRGCAIFKRFLRLNHVQDPKSDGTYPKFPGGGRPMVPLLAFHTMSFPLKNENRVFGPHSDGYGLNRPQNFNQTPGRPIRWYPQKPFINEFSPSKKEKKKPLIRDSQRLTTRTACPAGRSAATIIDLY